MQRGGPAISAPHTIHPTPYTISAPYIIHHTSYTLLVHPTRRYRSPHSQIRVITSSTTNVNYTPSVQCWIIQRVGYPAIFKCNAYITYGCSIKASLTYNGVGYGFIIILYIDENESGVCMNIFLSPYCVFLGLHHTIHITNYLQKKFDENA